MNKNLPANQAALNFTYNLLLVSSLFTAFCILSNLAAFKLAAIGQFIFPAGLVFFPLTYIFDDILTEVYGFNMSRLIIWSALLANCIVFFGAWLTTYLPTAPNWHDQNAFALIYRTAPRIFCASTLGYFCGEFANSYTIAKLKIAMSGKRVWLRFVGSSTVGLAVDTIIFTHVAFLFILPYATLLTIIATMYSAKLAYEIGMLPITYRIANYLKKKDQIDYYDYETNFNPFTLSA